MAPWLSILLLVGMLSASPDQEKPPVKLQRHELSVQPGTDIFEKARQALPTEWQKANQKHNAGLLKP